MRPQEAPADFAHEAVFRRVLIPLDGSGLAEQVLAPAFALGTGAQAEYTLLRVVMPTTELSYGPAGGKVTGLQESLERLHELDKQESKEAREYLERLSERLGGSSIAVKMRVALGERPAAVILDDASVHGHDLIALATHGRGGLKRLVLGSVADKVLRGAGAAVLVYRPDCEAAPADR